MWLIPLMLYVDELSFNLFKMATNKSSRKLEKWAKRWCKVKVSKSWVLTSQQEG